MIKKLFAAIAIIAAGSTPAFAQGTETEVIARIGMKEAATYHFVEVLQTRGSWVIPDIGYIDFADNDYREIFVGVAKTLVKTKRLTVVSELYFVQATGPEAKSARYVQPWMLVNIKFTPRLISQTVYFPYVPINKAGRKQHVLERTKLEYVFPRFKVGAGYSAYQFGDDPWQNKPFVTVTVKDGALGDMELWLQKMPQGVQLQARYVRVFK
ncbi:MAG: hypothetical protein AAB686_00475 [Patescibacteria group bacterium]